ncbi:MAG TPA: TIGR03618 family F420-dependent PPOX class oxidoreductase, partial [Acidimicrobiales bacterium]|nr:TIGR03618 family F420-dependent PPOX class oxidoreductase [Acidimicrobiales bacterium]
TLLRDGTPQTTPMWVDADDDHLLLNTEVHRQKYKNIERDPRVTVTIWEASNPYAYAELRGRVVDMVRGPEARSHIDQLSQRYNGTDYPNPIQSERVILKVAPK